jgi:hypothetical protein
MTSSSPWTKTSKEICETLADGLDVAGTIESADVFTRVGNTCLEVVVEATDDVGGDQALAYQTLCDLMETRLAKGPADEIIGCLLIETKADAGALAVGLTHMKRRSGMIVPIVPLSAAQAYAVADSPLRLEDFIDDATSLIRTAVERASGGEAAETLLSELDELIERRTS